MEFYNSLRYILNNDPEPLCLQFSTTKDFLGEVRIYVCRKNWLIVLVARVQVWSLLSSTKFNRLYFQITEVDLKPNGCNIPVTESNKTEYVE